MITAHIDKLPLVNKPDVFGLHPNAEIGYYTMAARNIWNSLIELQPQTGEFLAKLVVYTYHYTYITIGYIDFAVVVGRLLYD